MSVQNDVRLQAEGLGVGQSNKGLCPACSGGKSREVSFSVTRDQHGLLYNCYRAKCGIKGFVGTSAPLEPATKTRDKYKIREYYHPVLPLEAVDEDYFYQRFEIADTRYIFRSERGEYILPILDARGYTRGYTVRQPIWAGSPSAPRRGDTRPHVPKARCFPHVQEPMQSFYRPATSTDRGLQILVAVEDQISAIKVSQAGLEAVALCGTIVGADKIREWSALAPRTVLIALDEDATDVAFKIARKWGLAFDNMRVVMLDRDLKDELQEDILHILGVE